jgi:polar amino acid transport system substrate-binding protein
VRKMNNIKRKISISFIICMIIAVLCGCRDNEHDVNANEGVQLKEIIIGSDIQPPFNYVDSDGNPTGIDVELATEAFRRMGYKAVFVNINWDDKQELLSSHTIDCIWGSFSMNGREDKYRWAGPYMKSRIVIAVNKDSNIYTIEDLWDKTVAVQAASKPEEMFLNMEDSRIPRIRSLLSMKNRELTYPMLSKGYADALAVNEVIINQYMKDYNMQFRILDEALDTVGLGVAFDKNDKRDIDRRLTDILINMRDDGTEKEILEKYVGDTDKYLEVGAYE